MRRIMLIVLTLVIIFSLAGCSSTTAGKGDTSTETSDAAKNSSTDEKNKSQTDSLKEETKVKKMGTINITIGSSTFIAALEDNDTVKAFVKLLPLTIDMSELNGNEKYNFLSSKLPADTSSSPGTINEGDLMLYGDNCVVLFYKTFKSSYSYVKLGHINNTAGLTKTLGSGKAKVTFEFEAWN